MITPQDTMPAEAGWFTSSYSNEAGGECVEAAHLPGRTAVRDSKNPVAGRLTFTNTAWKAFTERARTGAYDL